MTKSLILNWLKLGKQRNSSLADSGENINLGRPGTGKSQLAVLCLTLTALAGLSTSAQAGSYAVSYSGGRMTFTIPGVNFQPNLSYTLYDDGFYSSGGGTAWGSNTQPDGSVTSTSGTAKCQGEITATFTWQPDDSNDTPPQKVVLAEEVSSSVNSHGGATTATCSSGIGEFPFVSRQGYPDTINGDAGGTRYKIKSQPGPSFTVTCSPSAEVAGTGPGSGGGGMGVRYKATASPLDIMLGGGIGPRDDKQYLIGQRVSATVATGGLTANSFNWTVNGGEPFKNWTADQSESVFTPLGTETGAQMDFHFKKWSGGAKSTVSTPLHLVVPSGALPAAGLDVTLERKCSVDKPFNSLAVWTGTTQAQGDPADPVGIIFLGASPRALDDWGNIATGGIIWEGTVYTADKYGPEKGGWNYTQLITPHRVRRFNGNMQRMAGNDFISLDGMFGYGLLDPELHSADGSQYIERDQPSDFWEAGSSYLEVLDSFVTYTLYKPPGDGSCYVPLKNLQWFWQGQAHPDSSGIWQISNTAGSWSFKEDFPNHPIWTSTLNMHDDNSSGWQNE